MNWYGSGFITIIRYSSGTPLNIPGAILTESEIELAAEDTNVLITEDLS